LYIIFPGQCSFGFPQPQGFLSIFANCLQNAFCWLDWVESLGVLCFVYLPRCCGLLAWAKKTKITRATGTTQRERQESTAPLPLYYELWPRWQFRTRRGRGKLDRCALRIQGMGIQNPESMDSAENRAEWQKISRIKTYSWYRPRALAWLYFLLIMW